jgi:hypothetical protein
MRRFAFPHPLYYQIESFDALILLGDGVADGFLILNELFFVLMLQLQYSLFKCLFHLLHICQLIHRTVFGFELTYLCFEFVVFSLSSLQQLKEGLYLRRLCLNSGRKFSLESFTLSVISLFDFLHQRLPLFFEFLDFLFHFVEFDLLLFGLLFVLLNHIEELFNFAFG